MAPAHSSLSSGCELRATSDILAAEPSGRNNIGCVCGVGGHREIGGKDGAAERHRQEGRRGAGEAYLFPLDPP